MFITSKNKYLSNDMKIFGTCSIPLNLGKPINCEKVRNMEDSPKPPCRGHHGKMPEVFLLC